MKIKPFVLLLTGAGKTDDPALWNLLKGFSNGAWGETAMLKELGVKYPKIAQYLPLWGAQGQARQEGFTAAAASALKLPLIKDAEGTPDTKCHKLVKLHAIGELAAATSDAAILKYGDSAFRSDAVWGLEALVPAKSIVKHDIKKAYEYGLSLPSGFGRTAVMGSALFDMARENPDQAIATLGNTPAGSYEEQLNLIMSLENAFKQTDKVTNAELPDLLKQTDALKEKLKAAKPH